MRVRCRQIKACSTRHTSSYNPVILSWRQVVLSPRHTHRATAFYLPLRPARAIAQRSAVPGAQIPCHWQHLTSPPPPSSSSLRSPSPASTQTVLIGRRGTLTWLLGSRMWPSRVRRGRARASELDGPVAECAPWWLGGLEVGAADRSVQDRERYTSSW